MGRIASPVAVVLAAGTLVATGAASSAAALTLPAGFQLVNYPTGQAAYNLTNFAWLADGGLLTSGKDGTVTYVPPAGSPTGSPRVLTTVPSVRAIDDHGMLGFAPANDYASTGHVYISYDKGDPASSGYGMVEQWTAAPAGNPTSFTKTATIIDGSAMSPPLLEIGSTHSIDSVVVAPDDTLFLSIGDDAGNNGDPNTLRAQDLDQPYGKLLHFRADGAAVPSNPYYSLGSPRSWRSLVYAYGFRNPFRFDLDPRSGIPHLGDVGWRTTEEVDTVRPGMNGGWPCYEGTAQTTFSTYSMCQSLYTAGTAQMPITTYPHAGSGAAVVGGMHYTGASYPAGYVNSFFYGDYSRGELWTLATDTTGRLTSAPEGSGFGVGVGGPVAFHPGPNGDVTFGDLLDGNIKRLIYTPGNRAPVANFTSTTDGTRMVTFDAAASYEPDGDPITYSWDFGDGTNATGEAATHTYSSSDPVTVRLTVGDQLGAIDTATATVHPANHTPVITLDAPPPRTYAVGETVDLSASAADLEDGTLPVTWTTVQLHCPFPGSCHIHPDGTTTATTYSHPFPDYGGTDSIMVITAQATDSAGATANATYEAKPGLRTLAVNSPVAVQINGLAAASQQVVPRSTIQLYAPTTSTYWQFNRWSDGGEASHSYTMPDSDATLTAYYDTQIDLKYAALGGSSSLLGSPAAPEYDLAGSRARNFSGGRIYWSGSTGAHEVHGQILAKYLYGGGISQSGFPTSDQLSVTGGQASYFTQARIYWTPTYSAHWSNGYILAKYLATGGPDGYGMPTTDVKPTYGGYYAFFTGGRSIFWSRATAAHLVKGAIHTKYASMGSARSCLGFPTTDEYAIAHGWRNRFVRGTITYLHGAGAATTSC